MSYYLIEKLQVLKSFLLIMVVRKEQEMYFLWKPTERLNPSVETGKVE